MISARVISFSPLTGCAVGLETKILIFARVLRRGSQWRRVHAVIGLAAFLHDQAISIKMRYQVVAALLKKERVLLIR